VPASATVNEDPRGEASECDASVLRGGEPEVSRIRQWVPKQIEEKPAHAVRQGQHHDEIAGIARTPVQNRGTSEQGESDNRFLQTQVMARDDALV
jgi:hypothetical protein